MEILSSHNQISLATDPKRLTITLPMGQDMRDMSFTKEQQDAAAAKRRVRSKDHPARNDCRPARGLYTLKTISSTGALPQQSKDVRPTSSSSRPRTRSHSRGISADKAREVHWQDMEIPSELDFLHASIPDEIRNIVQESLDEHRAMQASRRSHLQAIVVRTTITQYRSREEVGKPKALSESSVSASSRRANSSQSGDMSSARSLGLTSTTSLNSSEGESGLVQPPSMYDDPRFILSQEDLSTETGVKANPRRSRDKPLKERGVFKIFTGWKGKEADYRDWDDDRDRNYECKRCFDTLPPKAAVLLPCQHRYCSHCFSQLVINATRSESTFPPKCCLQKIPRRTIRSRLSPNDLALLDQKTLEYAIAVGHRYYCASPECAKWIDVRAAHSYEGCLICPHCGFSVCILCRAQGHGKGQNCPNKSGPSTTLQQPKRAGWQKCYHCRTVVELNGGYKHVACRCGAHFW